MSSSKRVLIITYYWPPSGGVGVQRWMNFAIELKKLGIEPIILTPENPQFEIKDENLLKRVEDIQVEKVPIWEPFDLFHSLTGNKERKNIKQGSSLEKSNPSISDRLTIWARGNLMIPDPRVFWVKAASKKAMELMEEYSISTIITTGPPHSIHLIGRKVKRKTDVQWIADFRDPWSKWDVLEKLNASILALEIHRRLETSVLKEADHCLTVSKRLADSFGGIEVLHNGMTVRNKSNIEPNESHFTIGYFGLLNEVRNPRQLWQLLDQMCRESQVFANKLRIRIGGIVSESIQEEIRSYQQLNSKVEFLGYLSHQDVQDEYRRCNVLLLLLNKSDNSNWILPVKFFEYLASERLILGLGERKSDLGDLMNAKDVGEILAYSELDGIRGFLEDVFENQRRPNPSHANELLKTFSHENLVKKLKELIEKE